MGRHNGNRGSSHVYGRANKETRSNRIIKAYRTMDVYDSERIAATVGDLDFDEEALQYKKIPKNHQVFLLDPRAVNRHFKNGFEQGFNFANAIRKVRDQGEENEDRIEATLDDVVIKSRKHVLGRIASRELREEIVAMKAILGEEGMKGLRGTKAARAAGPMIYLARLALPLPSPEVEHDFKATLESALVIHQAVDVSFGPVQVAERPAR